MDDVVDIKPATFTSQETILVPNCLDKEIKPWPQDLEPSVIATASPWLHITVLAEQDSAGFVTPDTILVSKLIKGLKLSYVKTLLVYAITKKNFYYDILRVFLLTFKIIITIFMQI